MRIDWWTLALQTVNVLILILILGRFFFRPVMDIVVKRQQEANKLLSEAARARQQATDTSIAADKARAEIAAERQRLVAEAQGAARTERENLIAQTSQEIAKLRSEANVAIARDRAAAEKAIIDHASELAVDIAQRLLARLPRQVILHAFVEEICRGVRALSSEARENLASTAATDHPIEVVAATPLSGEETRYVGAALNEAVGRELSIAFRSDPAIIAGIELRGKNTIIRNSWRADLDRIRRELSRDEHAPSS
jgi:F-type H+-transporting ATPase subunit b